MEAGLPAFVSPRRLTREQAKAAKARDQAFHTALKSRARACGWSYAGGVLFRQDGDWFANAMPRLLLDSGCSISFSLKPMALDPIFWDIVGLPENAALPLSFRANGAWVLRAPAVELQIAAGIVCLDDLAEAVFTCANEALCRSRAERSLESLLRSLGPPAQLGGQILALAICLHILSGDLDAAAALCREASEREAGPFGETGGFTTHLSDGRLETFVDQAKSWVAARRRSSMIVVSGC
jgi:hypothetical protein